jgi:hypothetical protein
MNEYRIVRQYFQPLGWRIFLPSASAYREPIMAMLKAYLFLMIVGDAYPVRAVMVNIDFEELLLGSAEFYNGSDLSGGFSSRGAIFNNLFTDFGGDCCWNGWAYSRTTDSTTPGPANQYSALPGSGANGSLQYGVAFSGADAGGGIIPQITLPENARPISVNIANTTYAALSMLQGDPFAKQFGGPTGNDPDWFLLQIEGLDENGQSVGNEVSLYLADYRFSDPSEDFILEDWTKVELDNWQGLDIKKLAIHLSSSDNGMFGMNTPAYVAWDDLIFNLAVTPGDFNLDTFVDGSDLTLWQQNFGILHSGGTNFTDGDADEDSDVDGSDFLIWQQHFGVAFTQSSLGDGMTNLSVPEPTSYALLIGLLLYGCANRGLATFSPWSIKPSDFSTKIFPQERKS